MLSELHVIKKNNLQIKINLLLLKNTFSEFVEKKKNFPIKPNDWVKKAIKETFNVAHDIEKYIPQLNSAGGCCGGGK